MGYGEIMYYNKKISVTIPVFNEENHIQEVLEQIPSYVDYIVVVDDASSDNTYEKIQTHNDKRVHIIEHKENMGVGKSTVDGHILGIELGADILVRVDGDNQMDTDNLPRLLEPLITDSIDYTKGNRLCSKECWKDMPKFRLLGNFLLTYINRILIGCNKIQDPQNGFTAIKTETFNKIKVENLKNNFLFENSMLLELHLIKANMINIDIKANYGDETSHLKVGKFILGMFKFMFECFYKRIRNIRK